MINRHKSIYFTKSKDVPLNKIKLGEIITIIDGLTYSPNDLSNDVGNLKVLRSSNIKAGKLDLIDLVYVKNHDEISKEKYTRKDDILLCVRNGSSNLIGKNCIIKDNIENCTHGAFMSVIRSENANYIHQLLNTRQAKKEIQKDLGATINQITKNNLKNMNFSVHLCNEMQRKIGDILSQIDNLIIMHVNKLKDYKKSKMVLLDALISTEPHLFFNKDKWLNTTLNDCFEKIINTIYVNDLEFYKQVTVSNNGLISSRGVKQGAAIGRKRQFSIPITSDTIFTFTRQGLYSGAIGIVPRELGGAIVTENMPLLRLDTSQYYDMYMWYYFNSKYYKNNVLEKLKPAGTAQSAIHEKDWLKSSFKIPKYHYQEKNSNLLSSMDKLIELEENKLEKLELMKKYYLQQIFD